MLRLCASRFLRRVTLSLFHRLGFLAFTRLASASCRSAGAGTSGRSSLGPFVDLAMACESSAPPRSTARGPASHRAGWPGCARSGSHGRGDDVMGRLLLDRAAPVHAPRQVGHRLLVAVAVGPEQPTLTPLRLLRKMPDRKSCVRWYSIDRSRLVPGVAGHDRTEGGSPDWWRAVDLDERCSIELEPGAHDVARSPQRSPRRR